MPRATPTVRVIAPPDEVDLYELLQVSPRATDDVIKAAYRVLARTAHPDVNAGVEATRLMRALNSAYEELRDPTRRADALDALARLTPPAIPYLASAVGARDPYLRRSVVEALGRLSHPAASAGLHHALSDNDAIVRRSARRARSPARTTRAGSPARRAAPHATTAA